MNISNIQFKIRSLKLSSKSNNPIKIKLSLRLGTILSSLSDFNSSSSLSPIQQTQMILTCDDNTIQNNPRVCLVIYSVQQVKKIHIKNKSEGISNITRRKTSDKKDDQKSLENKIIGMSFISLNGQQNKYSQYKIQQCDDPSAEVELSFCINHLEVKNKDTSSQASKSSYAEIKQFHNFLSKGNRQDKDSRGKFEVEQDEFSDEVSQKYNRLNKNKKNSHKRNDSSLTHNKHDKYRKSIGNEDKNDLGDQFEKQPSKRIKTEQLDCENQQSFQYPQQVPTDQDKIQNQLAKALDKNMILTNLLLIQQQKFQQAQAFIKKLIQKQGLIVKNQNIKKQNVNQLADGSQKRNNKQKMINNYNNNKPINKQDQKYKSQFQILAKQRDQLYEISQQLFQRTKIFKQQNQKLQKTNKSYEIDIFKLNEIIEGLRSENQSIRKQLFKVCDQYKQQKMSYASQNQVIARNIQLQGINVELNQKNKEIERKLKESLKAMADFKNDALEARQQLIVKQQELRNFRSAKIVPSDDISLQEKSLISEKSPNVLENIMKNIEQSNRMRYRYFSIMNQKHYLDRNLSEQEIAAKIMQQIKKKITQICNNLKKNKRQSVSIIEMRQNIMMALNQYDIY